MSEGDDMTITDGFDLVAPVPYAEIGPPHQIWPRPPAESPAHQEC